MMPGASAADCARQAAALAASGDVPGAHAAFDQALARFPGDAALANSAGNFHARQGDNARALALFGAALRRDPGHVEAALNLAVVSLRLGRPRAALDALLPHERTQTRASRYWLLRADAAKALGDYAGAAALLDRARACDPASQRVNTARARLSLERGEARSADEYEAALIREPGNFDLMLGYAQALQTGGQPAEARAFLEGVAGHFPAWLAGQAALAELRWDAGEHDSYTAHFAAAVAAHPAPASYLAWADRLSGNDLHAQAAEVLGRGLALWPDDADLALARAIALGEAGEAEAAERILRVATAPVAAAWALAQARNALRLGMADDAAATLEPLALAGDGDVTAWALLDTCWRLLDDPRHAWLHGQKGLVREIALDLGTAELLAIRNVLETLHTRASIPLGQSVKEGTQTRGALFARGEPELARLKAALEAALACYRDGLPPADDTHPLLTHRDLPWLIAGSWSVRFSGRGRHAAHIHPRGMLSSACYMIVPEQVGAADGPGWLELGRPPASLRTGLPPLVVVKPRPGHCALFPSTLFHGTRPIDAGERMTVAFDVQPER